MSARFVARRLQPSARLKASRCGAIAVALVLGAPALVRAQTAPPAPKNLQVLPKDTPAIDVLATMQQFTRALGVQCTYCHVEQTAPLLTAEEQQAAAAA